MTVYIPQIVAGEPKLSGINTRLALIEAALNNVDGSVLTAASVPSSALAKAKSFHSFTFTDSEMNLIGTTDKLGLICFILPNLDGAANSTWRYLGASVAFRTVNSAMGSGARIDVKRAPTSAPQTTTTIHQVAVDSTKINVTHAPTQQNVASAVSLSSGDIIRVDFSSPTDHVGDVTGVTVVLFFSAGHVGT